MAGGDAPEDELWVDKYAPRSFLELLSDEGINRGVVRWLKSWDAAVFGTGQAAAAAPRSGGPMMGGGRQGKPLEDRRPEQRVLLMGGPPGSSCDCPLLLTICTDRRVVTAARHGDHPQDVQVQRASGALLVQ